MAAGQNFTIAGQTQAQEKAQLSRQMSIASLFGLKNSLNELTKSFGDKTSEAATSKSKNDESSGKFAPSEQKIDKVLDFTKRSKKVNKKKGKLSFRDVVNMKLDKEPIKTTHSSQDPEQFKALVFERIREAINTVKVDADNKMTVNNVLALLRTMDIDTADDSILDLIRRSIVENSGQVDIIDLDATVLRILESAPGSDLDPCVISAFKLIDQDEDGYISKSDIKHLMDTLGQFMDDGAIMDMIKTVSPNQQNTISLRDFSQFLLGKDITARRPRFADLYKSETLSPDRDPVAKDEQANVKQTNTGVGELVSALLAAKSRDESSSIPLRRELSRDGELNRSFFGGKFVPRAIKALEGLFDSLSAGSCDREAETTAISETYFENQKKSTDAEENRDKLDCPIKYSTSKGTNVDTWEDQELVREVSEDVSCQGPKFEEVSESGASEEDIFITPEIYVKITQWKHEASVQVSKKAGLVCSDAVTGRKEEIQNNAPDSVSSRTVSTGFGSMSRSGTASGLQETTSEKQWELQSDNAESREQEYIEEEHSVEGIRDDAIVDMVYEAKNITAIEEGETHTGHDDGIGLEGDLMDHCVNKPEYVQRWLSSPVVASPRMSEDYFGSQSAEGEEGDNFLPADRSLLAPPLDSRPDFSLTNSRSNFSNLRNSFASQPSIDSSDSGSPSPTDDASTNLQMYKLGVTLSYRSEIDAGNPVQAEAGSPEPRPASAASMRQYQGHRPAERRRCYSAISRSLTPPNKIPLVCKTIELQELEVSSPVTANLFSNRKKFGSLPKNVSNFIVLRKSSCPERGLLHNNKQTNSFQEYTNLIHFKKLSQSSLSMDKLFKNKPLKTGQSYSRSMVNYLNKSRGKIEDEKTKPESFVPASPISDRIQKLQSLLLQSENTGRRTKNIEAPPRKTFTNQSPDYDASSSKNVTARNGSNTTRSDLFVLESLKIDTTNRYPSVSCFKSTPRYGTFANVSPAKNLHYSPSLSRQLEHSGMTYKMGTIKNEGPPSLRTDDKNVGGSAKKSNHRYGYAFESGDLSVGKGGSTKETLPPELAHSTLYGQSFVRRTRPTYSARSDSACMKKSGVITLELPSDLRRYKKNPHSID